jgi:hypothetical protein
MDKHTVRRTSEQRAGKLQSRATILYAGLVRIDTAVDEIRPQTRDGFAPPLDGTPEIRYTMLGNVNPFALMTAEDLVLHIEGGDPMPVVFDGNALHPRAT